MEEPKKTSSDPDFLRGLSAARAELESVDQLGAAERIGLRQLLGVLPYLLELAEDRKFETEASNRTAISREKYKGILSFATAVGGFIALFITTYFSIRK